MVELLSGQRVRVGGPRLSEIAVCHDANQPVAVHHLEATDSSLPNNGAREHDRFLWTHSHWVFGHPLSHSHLSAPLPTLLVPLYEHKECQMRTNRFSRGWTPPVYPRDRTTGVALPSLSHRCPSAGKVARDDRKRAVDQFQRGKFERRGPF